MVGAGGGEYKQSEGSADSGRCLRKVPVRSGRAPTEISVTAGLPFAARITKRTKRAEVGPKVTDFMRPSAAQFPDATSENAFPLVLVRMR
jgi:hypothetical protein